MENAVYKIIEVVGSSATSIEDAIQNAITRSSQSVEHLSWFNIIETRGNIKDGLICTYQVVVKLGFHVDAADGKEDLNFDITSKQQIVPESPAKTAQEKFIAEGGNSQPLSKPNS